MSLLRIEGLSARIGPRQVLDEVDLTLDTGEVVGVIGPNGAGKSSLLRVVAGLLPMTRGELRWRGQPLMALPALARARAIGYLPQGPAIGWPLSVREVVALGRRPHAGVADRDTDAQAIETALNGFELRGFAARQARKLSGGEQMRVHLARLHAGEHELLLVDEPTAALDPRAQLQVLAALRALAREGRAVLLVLHDLALAARCCDRLLVLANGRPVACDSPARALDDACLVDIFGVRGLWQREGQTEQLLGITALTSP